LKERRKRDESKTSPAVLAKLKHRRELAGALEQQFSDQFNTGRLLACISSRPGQCGRCDGYILEGKELDFYQRKITKKK